MGDQETEPEWLIRWRSEKVIVDPDSVVRAIQPFGVVRKTMTQLKELVRPGVVFITVSGTASECARTARRVGRNGATVIRYSTAGKIVEASRETPKYYVAGMTWSVIRADVSAAVKKGECCIIDRKVERDNIASLAKYCFYSGATAVIAICITTEYEEEWSEDGITGVVWLSD